MGGRGEVQKGDGNREQGAACPAVTVPPPPGVGVPGDAAGAASRRVLPQDLAFPPAPAPGRPESGPAVAARGPRDATQQRQALLGRRGRGRGRARGSAAPPGRSGASRGAPARGSHALHARARLPRVQAHPGAAGFGDRGPPTWPGHPSRSHQPAPTAARPHWTPRADRARMTVDGAGHTPQLTSGTRCAPGGQEAAILPSVPGEFRAQLRSRPAPPSELERGCRRHPHSIPHRGREERRDRGLQGLGTVGAAPGVGKRSAGRTSTWDCSDAPRLDTALHTSGGGEGLWTCGCLLVPLLSSLSLFFGGRNLRISMRRPQGEGQLGPYTSPCHISAPVGIKKEQNPKTGETCG